MSSSNLTYLSNNNILAPVIYTTIGTYYEVPNDGYITIYHKANCDILVRVYGADKSYSVAIRDLGTIDANHSLFVKKGMYLYIASLVSGSTLSYYELS